MNDLGRPDAFLETGGAVQAVTSLG
jgi:hypothetical protein